MKIAGYLGLLAVACAVSTWWFWHRTPVVPVANAPQNSHREVSSAAKSTPIAGIHLAVAQVPTQARKSSTPELDPAYVRQVMHDAHVGYMSAAFGDFIRDAALTAEQGAELLELLAAERAATLQPILDARDRGGYWGDNPYIEQMVVAAATSRDGDIAALLGSDKFAKFQDYRATEMLRMTVNELNDDLVDRGEPLSDAQTLSLIQTFATLTDGPERARHAPVVAVVNVVGMHVTPGMVDAARSILSPTQLAALEALRVRQQTPPHTTIGSPGAPGGPPAHG